MYIELAVFDVVFLQQEKSCENENHGIMSNPTRNMLYFSLR